MKFNTLIVFRRACLVAVLATLGLTACSEKQSITIPFQVSFQGQAVTCSSAELKVNAMTFFVHQIELQSQDGNWHRAALKASSPDWQTGEISLMDLAPCKAREQREGLTQLEVEAPAGDYQALAFTVGIPEALNHLDANEAEGPLGFSKMHWHWSVGYKFAYMDLVWQQQTVRHHLGSTACRGDIGDDIVCQQKNRPTIRLAFQPGQSVQLELRQLFSELPHARCFGKPQDKGCPGLFALLGIDDGQQMLFRAR
ncbi:MbnP family copper-binding protein [Motilimonas pumila]|uniref:Metallo-mystery pair system four-Cys motif protein n=1 Tax=Motilimonas pumila TaxID=2303987 RepID=A0A418YE24_9GAMM|nr:MbnP family copper-binding protein [Motilimonas pumila]RJG42800.1 metallo-mystery pair system four-Cys motif protein [Motilimonas pumila]